jgi:hypothetical protein
MGFDNSVRERWLKEPSRFAKRAHLAGPFGAAKKEEKDERDICEGFYLHPGAGPTHRGGIPFHH